MVSLHPRYMRLGVNTKTTKVKRGTSTYLSLHPSPVVRPIPPRRSLPSRCLRRRLRVSRSSLNRRVFVFRDAETLSKNQQCKRLYKTGLPVDMVLPGRADVSRAVITLERGDISPSLNITCLHAKKSRKKNANEYPSAARKRERNGLRERGMQIQTGIRFTSVTFQLPFQPVHIDFVHFRV